MIEKIKDVYLRRYKIRANLYFNRFKQVILDECGSVDMSKIGHEAIGVLALIVIFTIIPIVGNLISNCLVIPKVTQVVPNEFLDTDRTIPKTVEVDSPWNNTTSGINLWEQVGPIFQIAAVIVVVGFILKIIYNFKTSN